MAALFGTLAGVSVIEAALVHLVVMRWSAAAAWVLTGVEHLRHGLAGRHGARVRRAAGAGAEGELVVRSGMMWTVRVPLETIRAVESGRRRISI